MKDFKTFMNEAKSDIKLVDDVAAALKDMDVKSKVYQGGENFNVSFDAKDGTEYYIRPNDKGEELFYIDADIDDFDSFKVKDVAALKAAVKKIMGSDDAE